MTASCDDFLRELCGAWICCVLQTSAAQREAMRRQLLKGKARNGVEFQMFQRGLKRSGATDPRAIASQLQSSLEASATAHNTLSAMLDNAKQVDPRLPGVKPAMLSVEGIRPCHWGIRRRSPCWLCKEQTAPLHRVHD